MLVLLELPNVARVIWEFGRQQSKAGNQHVGTKFLHLLGM